MSGKVEKRVAVFWVIFWIVIFFPIGIYLIWKNWNFDKNNPEYTGATENLLFIIYILLFLSETATALSNNTFNGLICGANVVISIAWLTRLVKLSQERAAYKKMKKDDINSIFNETFNKAFNAQGNTNGSTTTTTTSMNLDGANLDLNKLLESVTGEGGWIDENTQVTVTETINGKTVTKQVNNMNMPQFFTTGFQKPTERPSNCKNCGASIDSKMNSATCEYCGSSVY